MELIKKYWFVKPECYWDLNNLLGSGYSKHQLENFILYFPEGFFATYDSTYKNSNIFGEWCYMPSPNRNKDSKKWLKDNNYEYMGIVSMRKLKLDKINKI